MIDRSKVQWIPISGDGRFWTLHVVGTQINNNYYCSPTNHNYFGLVDSAIENGCDSAAPGYEDLINHKSMKEAAIRVESFCRIYSKKT
jgi:hypothetical protein